MFTCAGIRKDRKETREKKMKNGSSKVLRRCEAVCVCVSDSGRFREGRFDMMDDELRVQVGRLVKLFSPPPWAGRPHVSDVARRTLDVRRMSGYQSAVHMCVSLGGDASMCPCCQNNCPRYCSFFRNRSDSPFGGEGRGGSEGDREKSCTVVNCDKRLS